MPLGSLGAVPCKVPVPSCELQHKSSNEPWSKLLVSPEITPIMLPYIIRYITLLRISDYYSSNVFQWWPEYIDTKLSRLYKRTHQASFY